MSTGHSDASSVPVCSAIAPNPDAVRFDPAWRTSTVVALAKAIAADGTFDAMPILADALQDAGCDNAVLLDHCRGCASHIDGCWVPALVTEATPTISVAPPPPQRTTSVFVEAAREFHNPASSQRESLMLLVFGVLIPGIVVGAGIAVECDIHTKVGPHFYRLTAATVLLSSLACFYLDSLVVVWRRRRNRPSS